MRKILLTVLALTAAVITASAVPAAAESRTAVAPRAPIAQPPTCVPDSKQPAPDWFCWGTYKGAHAADTCKTAGLILVMAHRATGSNCEPRNDKAGYDLWLRM